MCGITGWANLPQYNQLFTDDDEAVLRSMCAKIVHRGPDSEGVFTSENVALGMRRLAIIDVAKGEQPVFNEDKSIVVVMNGEIYNFRELRNELEKCGHSFNSNSDTEVLPHLYEQYGAGFVKRINGMFAFALWDVKRRKLLLARDRFGEKPLYYGVFDNKLFFASELKVLLANPHVTAKLNLSALNQFLAFDYVPAPLSIYENIYKLPAANTLTLENGEIKIEKYWQMSFAKPSKQPSIENACEELRELLGNAVKSQIVADVPLGVLLSGGVDSSSVAAFAQKFSNNSIKTFSIGFDESTFDESRFAREVAAHLGTEHHEQVFRVKEAVEILPHVAGWLDEPLSDASILPMFLLSKFVRQSVTVALGGDGGDELFAGYPMYRAHKIACQYEKIPLFFRRNFIETLVKNLPVSTKNMSFDFKAKRFINALANRDSVARHHSFFGSFDETELAKLLTNDVRKASESNVYGEARELLETCDATNFIERMQFLDTKFYLAEDILTKVDRASMANSLEVRAPFLDYRVAEFAASLPESYKLKGGEGKFILKRAVAPMLPDLVTKRPKKGFGIPVANWLNNEMKPLLNDLLAPGLIANQGLF
ncbi:MAG: asparagine synthase (glutamine-hydrolyzing), partial [Pyrinomonadaceae bacterium]|nr:asparagine synthase (glutamine-hydrolyzing) [Pyrinomonadaceae bacterium]